MARNYEVEERYYRVADILLDECIDIVHDEKDPELKIYYYEKVEPLRDGLAALSRARDARQARREARRANQTTGQQEG